MKVTKKAQKEFLKNKLGTDARWALRALDVVAGNQTSNELSVGGTHDWNEMGFTGVDGHILTSIYKFRGRNGYLTEKQMEIVFKKMPKYWKQVLWITDMDKLDTLIIASLNSL